MFPFENITIDAHAMIVYFVGLFHNVQIGDNSTILDQVQVCENSIMKTGAYVGSHIIVSNRLHIGTGAIPLWVQL